MVRGGAVDGGILLTVSVCTVGFWCSLAVTIGKLRARPQSIDISYQMPQIGWVEGPDYCGMVVTCHVYSWVTFPWCSLAMDNRYSPRENALSLSPLGDAVHAQTIHWWSLPYSQSQSIGGIDFKKSFSLYQP